MTDLFSDRATSAGQHRQNRTVGDHPMNAPTSKLPVALTTSLCALLTLNLVVSFTNFSPATPAFAQSGYSVGQPSGVGQNQPVAPGMVGTAGNTARMTQQLEELNQRLARIESKLDRGLSVKVTEVPQSMLDAMSKKSDAPAAKPEAPAPDLTKPAIISIPGRPMITPSSPSTPRTDPGSGPAPSNDPGAMNP